MKLKDIPILDIKDGKKFDYIFNVFPNPSKDNSTISFNLKVSQKVTLKITDILGNEVAELLNNEFLNIGDHHIQFVNKNIPSGIYFCMLKAGEYFETVKMVVIK